MPYRQNSFQLLKKNLERLFSEERPSFYAVVLYSGVVGLLSLAIPLAVQAVVNSAGLVSVQQPILVFSVFLAALLCFSAFVQLIQIRTLERIQRRLFVKTGIEVAERLTTANWASDSFHTLDSRMNRFLDVVTVQKLTSQLVLDGVAVLFQTIMGLLLLCVYHPILFVFAVLIGFGIYFIVVVSGRTAWASASYESKAKFTFVDWLSEMASFETVFHSVRGSDFALEKTDVLLEGWMTHRARHFKTVYRQWMFSLILQVGAAVLLLGLGSYLVQKDQLSLGQLVAAELVLALVLNALAKFGKLLENTYDLSAASEKVLEVTDLEIQVKAEGRALLQEDSAVSMQVDQWVGEPGFRVMFQTEGRAMKTALRRRIFGWEGAALDRVRIGGFSTRELTSTQVSQSIFYSSGHELPEVFSGSIAQNVMLNSAHPRAPELSSLLERFGLGRYSQDSEAQELPDSDKRLIVFARLVFQSPKILLLDEPFSGLDEKGIECVKKEVLSKDAPWSIAILSSYPDRYRPFVSEVLVTQSGGVIQ
jgi:putative ABC transport system ATP-binding protein